MSVESTALKLKTAQGQRTGNEQLCSLDDGTKWITESVDETPEDAQNHINDRQNIPNKSNVEISVHQETPTTPPAHGFPTTIITTSSSADTLSGEALGLHGPSSPSNLSLSLNGMSKKFIFHHIFGGTNRNFVYLSE